MTLEKFAEKMRKNVEEMLPKVNVKVTHVRKNNGVQLVGLVFVSEDTNISPTVYLEEFYDAYHMGRTMEEISERILAVYQTSLPKENVNFDFFKEYEKVKDRICFRLVNAASNEDFLEQIPFVPFLDLAIVFYYSLESEVLGDGSIQIYNNHMSLWGVTVQELYEVAMKNMPVICPVEFSTLADVVCDLAGDMEVELIEELRMSEPKLYMLSNEKRTNGAATMLYPGIMERIYEKIAGNFYIIPSSVHELIVWVDDGCMDPRGLADMITEVNHTQLREEEILAHHSYYYDGKDKRILIF